jgi:hypothetical protein
VWAEFFIILFIHPYPNIPTHPNVAILLMHHY